MSNEQVGSLTGLWRFPVKSMQGEQLAEAELGSRGMVGDRAYALIDRETGKVVSAKSVRLFPDVLGCRAAFVEPPRSGGELPAVRIDLPDGPAVMSDRDDADRVLSAFFRRDVTLARSAPDDFTIDQYLPDIEDADPAGRRDTMVEQKLGSALFAAIGAESPVPVGAFFDGFPLSVLTTSTLARLSELRPESRFDPRRFRMNAIVGTRAPGFVENDWVGRALTIGDDIRIRVAVLDARCVMTTLAQGDLARDPDVLKTLVQHNRLKVPGIGRYPCAGVYAVIEAPGTVRVGAPVTLT
jgi:uncharacterized protein YcbX